MRKWDEFQAEMGKKFQDAVDEESVEEAVGGGCHLTASQYLSNYEFKGYTPKPLTVAIFTDYADCAKSMDLEEEWIDALKDYINDSLPEDMPGLKLRGMTLARELVRVSKRIRAILDEVE